MTEVLERRLQDAVSAGLLDAGLAGRLKVFWQEQDRLGVEAQASDPVSRVDAEEVRFVRGFHDIFIAIGLSLFMVGLVYGLKGLVPMGVTAAAGAAAIWGLSEIFARRMRLALPSFLLTILFTPFFFLACLGLFVGENSTAASAGNAFDNSEAQVLILPALIATLGASLHLWRFRVPVGFAVVTAGVLFLAVVLVETAVPHLVQNNIAWFTLVAGLASFLAGMVFDSRDLTRSTINSDKGFWLHLMAAPLIVHSILNLATGGDYFSDTGSAAIVIAMFLLLSFVAILVDRRALLVSGLGYFGVALGVLLSEAELSGEAGVAGTLLVLGCFILLLGSAWRIVRRVLVAPVAGTPVMRFIPAAS
ncbi:hypothetical protein [Roseibium suaedae]|uniref:DUF2157 domain-containing protein n=1 Tax=Roseibium suaedae TaxID=735517 RepID=A0A1M6Z1G7_9HYPH|nr:hypothetical protein [Roseibium suaedae]SHL24195.1 hypothetical protein SAMN05444272_0099 [Roseibium suaedae]